MRQGGERAPQTEKILWPAGYSALIRVEELWEKIQIAILQVIGASVVTGLVFGLLFPVAAGLVLGRFRLGQILSAANSYVLYSILLFGTGTLLWAVWAFLVAARLYDEARNWRFGLRGEQAVAEVLFDGKVLRFPWCYVDRAMRQVTYNVDWILPAGNPGAYGPWSDRSRNCLSSGFLLLFVQEKES